MFTESAGSCVELLTLVRNFCRLWGEEVLSLPCPLNFFFSALLPHNHPYAAELGDQQADNPLLPMSGPHSCHQLRSYQSVLCSPQLPDVGLCSSLLPIAVISTMAARHLGKKGFILLFYYGRKSGQEFKQEPGGRN